MPCLNCLRARERAMVRLLGQFVRAESPSLDRDSGGSLRQDRRGGVEAARSHGHAVAAARAGRSPPGGVDSAKKSRQGADPRPWPSGYCVRPGDARAHAVSIVTRARLRAGRVRHEGRTGDRALSPSTRSLKPDSRHKSESSFCGPAMKKSAAELREPRSNAKRGAATPCWSSSPRSDSMAA